MTRPLSENNGTEDVDRKAMELGREEVKGIQLERENEQSQTCARIIGWTFHITARVTPVIRATFLIRLDSGMRDIY